MDNSQTALIGGTAIIVRGQIAYMEFPAKVIRETVEKYVERIFPGLAKDIDADHIPGRATAGGGNHRWDHGHDSIIDGYSVWREKGAIEALRREGHIWLTDFPTKAGVPIPFLSGSSDLGQWLKHDIGIHRGYLTMHWADTGVGFLAIAEGATDISQALNGTLPMNEMVFFDTFIEGSFESAFPFVQHWLAPATSAFGINNFNPVFIAAAGVENILAGIISTYQTVSVYVDPLAFFGSAGTSALIGFGLAYGVADESLSEASINGIRSGAVGAFYSLSPAFGYGALAGFVSYKLGGKLADIHNKSTRAILEIDDKAYELLLDELCKGNVHLTEFLDRAETHITFIDNAATLSTNCNLLDTGVKTLTDQHMQLNCEAKMLGESAVRLKSNAQTLPDDSPILTDLYRAILAR